MTIGQRIKAKREELGMSQEELAFKLGYKSRSSINKIELDGRNLRQNKIKEIADALQTTPAYIMGWEEKKTEVGLTFEELQLIGKWRDADDLTKAMVKKILNIE